MRHTASAALLLALGVVQAAAADRPELPVQEPVPPAGDVYGWRDAQGVVRYTSGLERVPEAARETAVRLFRDGDTGVALVLPLWSQPLSVAAVAPGRREPGRAARGDREPGLAPADGPRPAHDRVAAPLPSVAAAPSGSWAIQLEATDLSHWLGPLEALSLLEGRRLYRSRAEIAGQPWERLRLGFFPSLAAAREARRRLQAHFPGAWVDVADPAEQVASAAGAVASPGRLSDEDGGPRSRAASPAWAIQLDARPVDGRLRALTRLELLDRHRLYRRTVASGGGVWERLRLGDFASIESARAALRALRSSYPDAWIDRSDGYPDAWIDRSDG